MQRLEQFPQFLSRDNVRWLKSGRPEPGMAEPSAMIRRLAAALVDYHAVHAGGWATDGIEERHAEALRDCGVKV